MPIYEYKCESCGERSEIMQRISDPPLTTCEQCGGSLKKLISAPAFQFKGSGWYVTDYANKAKPDGGGDGKEAKSSDSGSKDGDAKTTKTATAGSSSSDKGDAGAKSAKSAKSTKSDT